MDPERPIEKVLRECARKRRDQAGAPFELHPANRRLLQGEVARTFKSHASARRFGWRSIFLSRARLAWGIGGIAVVLLAVGLVLLPSSGSKQQFLAKNETRSSPLPPAAAPASDSEKLKLEPPAKAIESLADKSALAANRSEELPARDLSKDLAKAEVPAEPKPAFDRIANRLDLAANQQPNFVLSNPPGLNGLLAANGGPQPTATFGLGSDQLRARETAATLALSPAASPSAAPALESEMKRRFAFQSSELSLRQTNAPAGGVADVYFADLQRAASVASAQAAAPATAATDGAAAPGASPLASVLVSFKMEQQGDELRIIDRDGSVYAGYLQNAAADSAVRGIPARPLVNSSLSFKSAPQPQALGDNPATGRYFFRVSGTNKSLNQKVVFSGNLAPVVDSSASDRRTNVIAQPVGRLTSSRGQPGQAWLLNSRVTGRALINDRQQIEINAVPAKP